MFLELSNKKHLLWIILILFVAIPLVAFAWHLIYTSTNNSTLILNIAPDPALITLLPDNTTLNHGENRLKPGSYTITVSADGFYEQSREITLTKDSTAELYIALTPTPENSDYYIVHAAEYEPILQYLTDQDFEDMNETGFAENPIASKIPFVDPGQFRVDTKLSSPDFTLVVTLLVSMNDGEQSTERLKQAFLNWLSDYRATSGDQKEYPTEYILY